MVLSEFNLGILALEKVCGEISVDTALEVIVRVV